MVRSKPKIAERPPNATASELIHVGIFCRLGPLVHSHRGDAELGLAE